jgi:hypothetical protein
MLDDGRNLEREQKVMQMGNENFIYIARNKWPGVPIHGKVCNHHRTATITATITATSTATPL